MNEYTALYVLAILLGVSALFMLGCKNERWACAGYAIHALTLCIMLAAVEGADGLDAMSVLTLACNVLAVPLVLLVAIAKTGMHERCVPAVVSPAVFMALAAGEPCCRLRYGLFCFGWRRAGKRAAVRFGADAVLRRLNGNRCPARPVQAGFRLFAHGKRHAFDACAARAWHAGVCRSVCFRCVCIRCCGDVRLCRFREPFFRNA